RQKDRHLQRESMVAIKVLMQAVVVARLIFKEKGRRPALTVFVANRQKLSKRWRIRGRAADCSCPGVRDRSELRIDLLAERGDRPRQRITEISVAPAAKTVPFHRDGRPEPLLFLEHAG